MSTSAQFLSPSEAAQWLGVSVKALRLYEDRGLLLPLRTTLGWRTYGPDVMRRAAEVVALRSLGLSLTQVQRVLAGNPAGLEPALAGHQSRLEAQLSQIVDTVERIRTVREDLVQGRSPSVEELARLGTLATDPIVAFELPWPWGGEQFELREIRAINYIIGSLGSGKTRLAKELAKALPGGAFVGLERLQTPPEAMQQRLKADTALKARVEGVVSWLAEEGSELSNPLLSLIVALEGEGHGPLVIDMIEQDLDEAAQRALIAHLRQRGKLARPIFAMTRSCAVLDLHAVGPNEQILLCPANHSPPTVVAPYPGAPGDEAVATCLASPAVRARTGGMKSTVPDGFS